MTHLIRFFLTWWGAFLLAALDSSLVFFMPLGIDALVIYLAARDESIFWLYPLLAAAGSTIGAAITYWIGRKAGEMGLDRLVPEGRLDRLKSKVNESGAIAIAVPALLPPPFPLTPFLLTSGALDVDRTRFFVTFAIVRLFRFSVEAVLARIYGRGVLATLQSDTFEKIIIGFIILAIVGTTVSAMILWRNTHQKQLRPA